MKATLREHILERVEAEHVDEVLFGGDCQYDFAPYGGGGGGGGSGGGGGGGGGGAGFGWHDDDETDYDCGDNGTFDYFAYRS